MARKRESAVSGAPAWMTTFADLLATILAFFVMLAAYSTQDKQKLQVIAGSMREAFGTQSELRYSGIIELDGLPTRTALKNVKIAPEDGSDRPAPREHSTEEANLAAEQDKGFAHAALSLRQALSQMPDIAEMATNIIMDITEHGLDIQLVDQDGRSMFKENSAQPTERVRKLLVAIAPVLRRLPNKVSITGHTAAARPGEIGERDQWPLSVGRAMAVRDMLANAGMPDSRFDEIVGRGQVQPLIADNPYLAVNRRVKLVLKADVPPLPPSIKP